MIGSMHRILANACIGAILLLGSAGCSSDDPVAAAPGTVVYDQPPEIATTVQLQPDAADFGDTVLILVTITNVGEDGGTFEFAEAPIFGFNVDAPPYVHPDFVQPAPSHLTLEPGASLTDTLRYVVEGDVTGSREGERKVPRIWVIEAGLLEVAEDCPWDQAILEHIK